METLMHMLEMGGYARFVWPCFIITGAAMTLMTVASLRSLRKTQKTLADLQNISHET